MCSSVCSDIYRPLCQPTPRSLPLLESSSASFPLLHPAHPLHMLLHLNPPPPPTVPITYCHLSPVSPIDANICLTVDKSAIRHGSKCSKRSPAPVTIPPPVKASPPTVSSLLLSSLLLPLVAQTTKSESFSKTHWGNKNSILIQNSNVVTS